MAIAGRLLLSGYRFMRDWMLNAEWDALIPAWISNHTHSEVCGEITYLSPSFNGAIVEVWEWISAFIPNFIMDLSTLIFKLMLVKRAPGDTSWREKNTGPPPYYILFVQLIHHISLTCCGHYMIFWHPTHSFGWIHNKQVSDTVCNNKLHIIQMIDCMSSKFIPCDSFCIFIFTTTMTL